MRGFAHHRRVRSLTGIAGLGAAVLAAVSVVLTGPPSAHAAATPSTTLVVNASQVLRPVTHVATGSLYGLANANTPADSLVQAIKPNTFVQKPQGGHQQPTGDILTVAPKAARAGAKVVNRLSDYYAGWPYQFSWSNWLSVVDDQIAQTKASGIGNLASYEPWNESDGTWKSANGTFEDFWTRTYREIRTKDSTTPIQGPSFSDNISDMDNFLRNAVATNTVPDIIAWHELIRSSKIAGDVATVVALENKYGISPRPIAIEEYAAPSEVGIPGALVGYIAKFERLGVHDAELAFWNQSGALGDLLTGQGGSPNGAYWLYKWYADMNGSMLVTTPPAQTGIDGAAARNSAGNEVDVVFGGSSGDSAVTVNGLGSLSTFGSTVHVKVEYTPSPGRTTAVSGPTTLSESTYTLNNGSLTVPVNANSTYGYHLVITPAAGSTTGGTTTGGTTTGGTTTGGTTTGGTTTGGTTTGGTTTGGTTTGGNGSSSCKVTLTPQTWSGGYTLNVTVANTGSAAVDGWKLGFILPSDQVITGAWNAGISPSSGSVTATNLSYNAQIPPGGNQSFGFQGTDTGSYSPPTAFTLNGTACTS
jgi:hypothetical protein